MADIDHFGEEEEEEGEGAPEGDEGEPLILVVVGAHLRAEVGDRPLAYRVRERIVAWLRERFGGVAAAAEEEDDDDQAGLPCRVVVCTDVLYLNDAGLRVWPTVSVGGPGVNALSAFLGDKLASVFVIDDVMMIQMDPTLEEVTAAVWGIDHDATVDAVDAFLERYLDQFMTGATRAWGGE